jgi:hypothetical protein
MEEFGGSRGARSGEPFRHVADMGVHAERLLKDQQPSRRPLLGPRDPSTQRRAVAGRKIDPGRLNTHRESRKFKVESGKVKFEVIRRLRFPTSKYAHKSFSTSLFNFPL